MASEKGDPRALKRQVVHLLLQYPRGIRFEDFAGTFHQLHGYHPRISLHGYRSLKKLLADMENVVVVEGNSLSPIMKIADGFCLDHWLEGDEENDLEISEGETENLTDEADIGGETALSEVLDLLVSLLEKHKMGLRIKRVQKIMLSRHGINMKKLSVSLGYRNILEFLKHQMPELKIQYGQTTGKCVVQVPEGFSLPSPCARIPKHMKERTHQAPDLSAVFVLIQDVLKGFRDGIKVKKLTKLLRKNHGFDLQTFCSRLGYKDVLSCLQDIHGLFLQNISKTRNCVVHLQACPFSSALSLDSDFSACSSPSAPQGLTRINSGTSSPTPSLDTGFSAGNTDAVPEKLTTKTSDLAATLVPILGVLGVHPHGMTLDALTKSLKSKHGFDLEAFCQSMGYEDVMSYLLHVPGLRLSFTNGRCPASCVVQLLSGSLGLPHSSCGATSDLDKPLPSSGSNVLSQESKPASCSSTQSQSSVSLSLDLEQRTSKSKSLIQNGLEQKAASCSSAASQSNTSSSLDMQEVANRLNSLEQKVVGRHPGPSGACAPPLLDASVPSSQAAKILEPINSASDLSVALVVIQDVVKGCSDGIKVKKLKKLLRTNHGFDLETFCSGLGYKDVLSCLQDIPGLFLQNIDKAGNCIVHFQSRPFSSALSLDSDFSDCSSPSSPQGLTRKNSGTSSPTPSLDTDFSAGNTDAVPEKLMTKTSGPSASCVPPLLDASQAAKMLEPVNSASGLIASEEGDPGALKLCVVHLLLQNPQGIRFGDFAGSFYQLHGYHPRISLHGYRSLKELLADMKNVVVVEGNSLSPVMKIADGFCLDHWLEGDAETDLEISEWEAESLTDEAKVGGEAGTSSPTPSLDPGFSAGNTDAVPEKLMTTISDLAAALVPILGVLGLHPHGMTLDTLTKSLKSKHGFDLEAFCQSMGYEDVMSCLLHVPGLRLSFTNGRCPASCVVQLLSGSLDLPHSSCGATSDLDKPLPSSGSNVLSQESMKAKPASCSSAPSQSSVSLSLDLKKCTDKQKAASCSSVASESSTSFSLGMHEVANKPNNLEQNVVGRHPALVKVLNLLVNLLRQYKMGLRINRVQKFMLSKHGVNMKKFSVAQGYKDILEFLEHQMPGLNIQYQENTGKCVVQAREGVCLLSPYARTPDHMKEEALSAAVVLIQDVLKGFRDGIKVKKLKKFLRKNRGFDLDVFYSRMGYKDVLSCLQDIPGLFLQNINETQNCVVHLQSCSSSLTPSFNTNLSVGNTDAVPEKLMTKRSDLVAVLVQILDMLEDHPLGMTPETLMKNLQRKHGFDLEAFCQSPSAACVPPLSFGSVPPLQPTKMLEPASCSSTPSQSNVSLSLDLEKCTDKQKAASFSSAAPQSNTSFSLDIQEVANRLNNLEQNVVGRHPGPSAACVSPLSFGSVPPLQPTKMLEPVNTASAFGDISKPSVRAHDISASKSQSQSLSFPASSMSTAVKNGIHPSIHVPFPVVPNHPSIQEACSSSSAKANNSCQSVSSGPLQKPSAHQFGGPSPVEEVSFQLDRQLPSKSNMTKGESSKGQDDLKQQVAHILAMHPEGMSLFQFRVAYSATYQRHLPLGNAASAKRCLMEMPDVVYMKNYGVQTLLLPVTCAMSSVKSGQPVSSIEEKAPVVLGHSLPRTVPVTEPNSEDLGGKHSKAGCPFPEPQLHKAPKPVAPVQEHVKMSPKPVGGHFIPQSPVVFPTYPEARTSGENLKPDSHLTNPWISGNSASVPSASQPASDNFGTRAQPVAYPSVPVLFQMPGIPPVQPVSFLPVSRNPSGIHFQKTAPQSSPSAQPPHVLPIRYAQTAPLIHHTQQQSCIHAFPQVDPYSAVQKSSRNLQHAQSPAFSSPPGSPPVFSPSRNMSQSVHQLEYYNHMQQDGLQHSSVVVAEKSLIVTPLDRKPMPPSSAYLRQYGDGNSLATSASTVSFGSHSFLSSSASLYPLDNSSSSIRSSNALPSQPPAFVYQQQSTSISTTTVRTSGIRPACSPSSLLDSTAVPYYNPLCPSGINNNSATQSSEPRASIHRLQYTSMSTSETTYPQGSTLRSSCQLSNSSSSVRTDYKAPAQANPMASVSKQAGSFHVSLPEKQMSNYSLPQNSPPPKSSDKCVIL